MTKSKDTLIRLGVDTGGTFTDFVVSDGERIRVHKVLSTPAAPESAILQGARDLGLKDAALRLTHGSTVATNAVLEGKGVATVFIANHGLGDMLTLARQNRDDLYDLQPPPQTVPVPAEYCLEIGGRLGPDGAVVSDIDEAELAALVARLRELKPRAVAINLLFSFIDDRFERRVAEAMPDGLFVSRSSAVLPEYKEYERGIATWLNAYVGPLVQGYLRRLTEGLPKAGIHVMQSSGETVSIDKAGDNAVHMLLSGPAGGLAGAKYIGGLADREQLLTFDMGGTSTDVALIDGNIQLTNEGRIGRYPVGVPMVDMHTIGAGGGSLAYLDSGGLLNVGPESAGADPGPACYSKGGTQATVTDANLVLERLLPEAFLGGDMALDAKAACKAVEMLGKQIGQDVYATAQGIIDLANEHMARALRVISVQRGIDPRPFTLMSFGGAGGLHVCALAEAMGMDKAMAPVHAGVLSALGMLAAPRGRQLSQTLIALLAEVDEACVDAGLRRLRQQGEQSLAEEGLDPADTASQAQVDLRYQGQAYTLTIPWQGRDKSTESFHRRHAERYGHRLDEPVELVNLRVAVTGPEPEIRLEPCAEIHGQPYKHIDMPNTGGHVPVYDRTALGAGQIFDGPALITEKVSTTYLAPDWRCEVDGLGNLLLRRVC